MGSLSELKALVSKADPYATEYVPAPPNYAKPLAAAGAGSALFGGIALNNARLLPKRTRQVADREWTKTAEASVKARNATSTADKSRRAAEGMRRINPLRPGRMAEAEKLSRQAADLRRAHTVQQASAKQARAALSTVRARQRVAGGMGLAALGAGAGMVGLAARNAKKRREASYA